MNIPPLQSQVSPEEWQLRVDLAACYRLIDLYGMADMMAIDAKGGLGMAGISLTQRAIRQQIAWLDSHSPRPAPHPPQNSTLTDCLHRPLSAHRSRPPKRLMGAYSPRSTRGAKKGYLIPRPYLLTDPQEE